MEDPTDPKHAKDVQRLFGVDAEDLDFKDEEVLRKVRAFPTMDLRMQLIHGMDCTKADTFTHIVKKPYAGMVVDCNYHFDYEDDGVDASANGDKFTTADGLKQMLTCFKQVQGVSNVLDYTVFVFCGFRQVEDFFKVMKEDFGPGRGQVFRYFWKKTPPIGAKNIHPERPTNVIECILVGVCFAMGREKLESWQANYGPKATDRINFLEVPSVVKKVRYPSSQTNLMGDWQKPRKLMRILLERHCNNPGRWLLEPMCGSGTASVVALTMGMNVVAIDWNRTRANEAGRRMSKLQDPLQGAYPSEEQEIRTGEEMKKLMDERAKARAQKVMEKLLTPEVGAGLIEVLPGDKVTLENHKKEIANPPFLLPAPEGTQPKEGGCFTLADLEEPEKEEDKGKVEEDKEEGEGVEEKIVDDKEEEKKEETVV